jgi:tight adherence protein B
VVTLAAGILTGICVFLVVGAVTGNLPEVAWRPPIRRRRRLQTWLIQAGLDLTPRQFLFGSALAGVLAFAVVTLMTGTPAVAVAPGVAVGLLPRVYFSRRRSARLREVQDAWPDGLRELVAGISAGLSLHQALVALAESSPDPLQRAFGSYPLLAEVIGVVPALETIREELASPTSDRVLEVLVLAHERGGHLLPEILRDLAESTVRDARTSAEMATDALEQKLNARAVLLLPWLVLVVLTIRPGHFRDFYQSIGGLIVVLVGGAFSLLGTWLVLRLGREPDEPRVFGTAAPEANR